jgi:carbamate kinase
MLVVVALGGNALLRRGEAPTAEAQRRNVALAAASLAPVAHEHDVVICHGNGPQVGLLALQAQAYAEIPPYPLDVLDAESEGMIGYVIEQELGNQLPERKIATLLTQVVVDSDDPAFANPSKPIGPVYRPEDGSRLARDRGWRMVSDGAGLRRAVPSPEPKRILEMATIRLLLAARVIVVCAGGGGIPVTVSPAGRVAGVEAVIDKDLTAALLGSELGAGALLILTDVDAVYTDWGTPRARPLRAASPDAIGACRFAAGSMAPKIAAARRFVTGTGGRAMIGALGDAARVLAGAAGTTIRADAGGLEWYR